MVILNSLILNGRSQKSGKKAKKTSYSSQGGGREEGERICWLSPGRGSKVLLSTLCEIRSETSGKPSSATQHAHVAPLLVRRHSLPDLRRRQVSETISGWRRRDRGEERGVVVSSQRHIFKKKSKKILMRTKREDAKKKDPEGSWIGFSACR